MSTRRSGDTARISRRERSSQLLDFALERILDHGYERLTMAGLAEAAGVSKPIVYRSYPNVGALLMALLRREQKRAEAVLDEAIPTETAGAHPREVLLSAAERVLDGVVESPMTWRLLLLPPEGTPRVVRELVERRRQRFFRRTRRLVRWGAPYLRTDDELDVDVVSRFLLALVEEEARMLLTDPAVDRATLSASNEGLIDSVAWRVRPAGQTPVR